MEQRQFLGNKSVAVSCCMTTKIDEADCDYSLESRTLIHSLSVQPALVSCSVLWCFEADDYSLESRIPIHLLWE